MRKTIVNWDELCELLKECKKQNKEVLLKPIMMYGEIDKKKQDKGINTIKTVHSITLEVIEKRVRTG